MWLLITILYSYIFHPNLCHGETQDTRELLAGRQVFVYGGYKDVQIFHFSVPHQVSYAFFNFTANETLACEPRNIEVYIQADAYPVVSPDDAEFPSGLWINRQKIHSTTLKSDLKSVFLIIPYPVYGHWFMAALIPDNSNRITQAGLFPSCSSWLQVQALYHQISNVTTLIPYMESPQYTSSYVSSQSLFKYYVSSGIWNTSIRIRSCQSNTVDGEEVYLNRTVSIRVQSNGLPDQNFPQLRCLCEVNMECQVDVVPREEAWHYISVVNDDYNPVSVDIAVIVEKCNYDYDNFPNDTVIMHASISDEFQDGNISFPLEDSYNATNETALTLATGKCWPRYNLVKKIFGGNFLFEFDLPASRNMSAPVMLNISNSSPTILAFALEPIIDIGGTLSIEAAIFPFMDTKMHNFSLISCVTFGVRPSFVTLRTCSQGYMLEMNTSSHEFITGSIMVPFPEPGPWYITFLSSCYLKNSSITTLCTVKELSILFSVSSTSCLQGKCGPHGSCYQYISAGFIFSTCVCSAGYRGWGCTDAMEAIPSWKLLLSTLLLTLSNLFFLPPTALAIHRRYYAEAVVFGFTMLFSTLYHACDQEAYQVCIVRLSVLQFCDFYSGILSFWVTLVAMACLPTNMYSVLHMIGAMVVALGVEYDRTGLWVFGIPALSAFTVMSLSWMNRCRIERICYPPRTYWLHCLLPGVFLAVVGLVSYAFLETEDNYLYVHSLWHVTMALSILLLLPPRKTKPALICGEVTPMSNNNASTQCLNVEENNISSPP